MTVAGPGVGKDVVDQRACHAGDLGNDGDARWNLQLGDCRSILA